MSSVATPTLKRTAAMSTWHRNQRVLGTINDPVAVNLREALVTASQILKAGTYNGKRISMIETGTIAKSIAKGKDALLLFLARKEKDIRLIQLMADSNFAMTVYANHKVCTVKDLLGTSSDTIRSIKDTFMVHNTAIPLVVRLMTDRVLKVKDPEH